MGINLDLQTFKASIADPEPPVGLSAALKALWWDAKGDWQKAHDFAQEREDSQGMRVHAYLHRKEGDPSNAAYWYRRCGVRPSTTSLGDEWLHLSCEFLGNLM